MSPLQFATERLAITPWVKISDIFSAVEAVHRKNFARPCNGAGKTTTMVA